MNILEIQSIQAPLNADTRRFEDGWIAAGFPPFRSSNQIHLERDGITRNSSIGKALEEYLDIRFNKRKQKGGERAGVISRRRGILLYSASLPLFPRVPSFTRCLRGRDIYLRASATKARNENMCWTQEASLASLFLFTGHIMSSNDLRCADIAIFRRSEFMPYVVHFLESWIRNKIKKYNSWFDIKSLNSFWIKNNWYANLILAN